MNINANGAMLPGPAGAEMQTRLIHHLMVAIVDLYDQLLQKLTDAEKFLTSTAFNYLTAEQMRLVVTEQLAPIKTMISDLGPVMAAISQVWN